MLQFENSKFNMRYYYNRYNYNNELSKFIIYLKMDLDKFLKLDKKLNSPV